MRLYLRRRLWKAWRVGFCTLYAYREFLDPRTGRKAFCVIDGPTWPGFGGDLFHEKYVTLRFPRRPWTRLKFFCRALFGPLKLYDLDPAEIQGALWAGMDDNGRLGALPPEDQVAISGATPQPQQFPTKEEIEKHAAWDCFNEPVIRAQRSPGPDPSGYQL
jgi:hypothetical protein